jgi:small basic protein (TIGR04137 family)
MSQHPSLRIDSVATKHRNVLKRHERIQRLIEQEKWNDRATAFGLPKVKSLKIKVKKIKAEKAEGAAAPAGAQPTAPAPAAAEKKKAPEKKAPEKKAAAGPGK